MTLQLFLPIHPKGCHFDRPTGVEKPLYFVNACTPEEAKRIRCTGAGGLDLSGHPM